MPLQHLQEALAHDTGGAEHADGNFVWLHGTLLRILHQADASLDAKATAASHGSEVTHA
jgi:hypothetical protein